MPTLRGVVVKDVDQWLAARVDTAQRLMPLFDQLPFTVREIISNAPIGTSWQLIRDLRSMQLRGRTVKQLEKHTRSWITTRRNYAIASGTIIARESITLAELDI